MGASIKLHKKDILELPVRRKIYAIVKKYAGSHYREIERKVGLSTGQVKYHLDYLVRKRVIKQEKTGNNVRYFVLELSDCENSILGVLRSNVYRKLILYLMEKGAATHSDIRDYLGLSGSTISWHLKRLREMRVIGRNRSLYRLEIDKDEVMKLLVAYRESFFDSLVDRAIEMWHIDY
jgi:predicted transcriptional regulator